MNDFVLIKKIEITFFFHKKHYKNELQESKIA